MQSKKNRYVIVYIGWGEVYYQVKPILEPIKYTFGFFSIAKHFLVQFFGTESNSCLQMQMY